MYYIMYNTSISAVGTPPEANQIAERKWLNTVEYTWQQYTVNANTTPFQH